MAGHVATRLTPGLNAERAFVDHSFVVLDEFTAGFVTTLVQGATAASRGSIFRTQYCDGANVLMSDPLFNEELRAAERTLGRQAAETLAWVVENNGGRASSAACPVWYPGRGPGLLSTVMEAGGVSVFYREDHRGRGQASIAWAFMSHVLPK